MDTTLKTHASTYSTIITAEDYNQIITEQHLYIAHADRVIRDLIECERDVRGGREVVELGCGPARLLPLFSSIIGVHLTGVDYDAKFVEYARKKMLSLEIVLADVATYRHPKEVDVFVSHGFHHHVVKGEMTSDYLRNVYSQLRMGGAYIVGDEFLPAYGSEDARKVKAVVWYSHIIAAAQKMNYSYLAQEEAKTLLDDLFEGDAAEHWKNSLQIEYVLESARVINSLAMRKNIDGAEERAGELLNELYRLEDVVESEKSKVDLSLGLSRGDFKICERVFHSEVESVGFSVEKKVRIGPRVDIGAMGVYVLRK